jgi:hypothetical protein
LERKADGSGVRYRSPGPVDADLKSQLVEHRAAILEHLTRPDRLSVRLVEMERDFATGALVHPDWHALPAGLFDDVPDPRVPRPDLPTTVMVVSGTEREVSRLPSGAPLPPEAVLWSQPGSPAHWQPGPGHALWTAIS